MAYLLPYYPLFSLRVLLGWVSWLVWCWLLFSVIPRWFQVLFEEMAGCQRTSPLKLAPIVTHQRVLSYCFSWLGGIFPPQLIFESSVFCLLGLIWTLFGPSFGSLWSQGFDHISNVRVRVPEVFVETTLHPAILPMRRLVYIYIYICILSIYSRCSTLFEAVKKMTSCTQLL